MTMEKAFREFFGLLTVEPVAIIRIWYLNDSPAALTRVLPARSALTISVLRINSIPVMTS